MPGMDEADFIASALAAEVQALESLRKAALGNERSSWSAALDLLQACRGHVVVSGMGKSGLIGAKIAATLSSLGQPSHVVHPSEAVHGDLGRIRPGDVVMIKGSYGSKMRIVVDALRALSAANRS